MYKHLSTNQKNNKCQATAVGNTTSVRLPWAETQQVSAYCSRKHNMCPATVAGNTAWFRLPQPKTQQMTGYRSREYNKCQATTAGNTKSVRLLQPETKKVSGYRSRKRKHNKCQPTVSGCMQSERMLWNQGGTPFDQTVSYSLFWVSSLVGSTVLILPATPHSFRCKVGDLTRPALISNGFYISY